MPSRLCCSSPWRRAASSVSKAAAPRSRRSWVARSFWPRSAARCFEARAPSAAASARFARPRGCSVRRRRSRSRPATAGRASVALRTAPLKPSGAFVADLGDSDPYRAAYRRLFAGALPGFTLAFFTVPAIDAVGMAGVLGQLAAFLLASLGAFFVLDQLAGRAAPGATTAVFAASAFGLFYWFNVPVVASAVTQLLGGEPPAWAVWEGRLVLAAVALAWLAVTLRKQGRLARGTQSTEIGLPIASAQHRPGSPIPPRRPAIPPGERAVVRRARHARAPKFPPRRAHRHAVRDSCGRAPPDRGRSTRPHPRPPFARAARTPRRRATRRRSPRRPLLGHRRARGPGVRRRGRLEPA